MHFSKRKFQAQLLTGIAVRIKNVFADPVNYTFSFMSSISASLLEIVQFVQTQTVSRVNC